MSHSSIQIALTVYLAAEVVLYIALIGQPRDPYSPAGAVLQLVAVAFFLWAIWSL